MICPGPVIAPCNQASSDYVIPAIYNVIGFEIPLCFELSNVPIFRPNYHQQHYENAIMIVMTMFTYSTITIKLVMCLIVS